MENDSFIPHQKKFCENFKFHPCLEPNIKSLKNVLNFYKEIITIWAKYLFCFSYLSSAILSQFSCFNLNIKIDNKSIFISGLTSKNINFVGHIFHKNDKTKSWDYIKSEYNLESKSMDSISSHALPKLRKDHFLDFRGNSMNLCIFDHHLIKKTTYTN